MTIDRRQVPAARDYLRVLGSNPRWHGRQERWHCPFCDDHSLTISRADRISCANGCVSSVSVVGFEAHRWDCGIEEAARQLGCWVYERPAGRAAES